MQTRVAVFDVVFRPVSESFGGTLPRSERKVRRRVRSAPRRYKPAPLFGCFSLNPSGPIIISPSEIYVPATVNVNGGPDGAENKFQFIRCAYLDAVTAANTADSAELPPAPDRP
ncbi:hypothetical protein EVAR_92334_1 [Eumeta japonica]|uniref:Uncharacterized protein n=1 Tax=Eumeta variegata TaxID=151549 RepID=A0A4C1TJR6_EUMVA|nr:hypothetical protein EVAR_92334_1 [Eumeta japonica]